MALVSLKSLLLPRQQAQQQANDHQPLLPDLERSASISSTETTTLTDKSSTSPTTQPFRLNPRIISDLTIGLSDGLTVPFALTAGLSALGTTRLVIYAGFAELVAGAISMGLGGYLGAKGEADGYYAALEETKGVVADDEDAACALVQGTFERYGFGAEVVKGMVGGLRGQPELFVEFLMRFQQGLSEADYAPERAYISGLTIALGYFVGGLVPLLPYLFFERVREALYCSVIVMAVALFVFGWAKTALVGECSRWACFQNAFQMLILGGLAAGAAMGCVKAIGG